MSEAGGYIDPADIPRDRLRAIGEIVPGVLRQLRRRLRREDRELEDWWSELVGEQASARTRVLGWAGGLLTIGVSSPSHMQEYQVLLRTEWKGRMAEMAPPVPVDRVKFRLLDRRKNT